LYFDVSLAPQKIWSILLGIVQPFVFLQIQEIFGKTDLMQNAYIERTFALL